MTSASQLSLPFPPATPEIGPFNIGGPLPSGVTLLEASAGTGKTFAIAGLAARFVAEGTALDQLLVVTFTRAATGELRDRVRERLVRTVDGLDRFLVSGSVDERDELLLVLSAGDLAEVKRRRDRVATAVAGFDAATIDTTHGFCFHVLSGLGVSGDVDLTARLVEDVSDLVEEVVDDLYVRKFWKGATPPIFSRAEALRIAAKVIGNPGALILPEPAEGFDPSLMRARLATAVIQEADRRKKAAGILTYDDLLTRLRDTLVDPQRGPAARRKLRERYRVVLVDEFQDTDLIQWEILSRAFVSASSTLVLIGDPKQSIYAFRGADVYSYLAAARKADARRTLAVNWRSDAGLLRAFDALFSGAELGEEGIQYRPVAAAPPHLSGRLVGAPHPAPLRIRVLDRDVVTRTKRGFAAAGAARDAIARDLAADMLALIESGAELIVRRADGTESGREPLRPGHLAVLVRSATNAATVQTALLAAGIPCVIAGAGSVFESEAAMEWLRLLEAVEQPTRRDRAASAALTQFIGWDAVTVATADEERWEELHILLHTWSALLRHKGAAALLVDVSASQGVPERVLSVQGGERLLTDIRHIGQLLHEQSVVENLGSAALVGWLSRRISERRLDSDDPDRSIRLESDAESVQILTIHRSKGLEFPIVYCPFAWDYYDHGVEIPVFHDPANANTRCVDVGVDESTRDAHAQLETVELRGEDLRLLYVALTRARHQVVMWWAGSEHGKDAALNRLLLTPRVSATVPPRGRPTPTDLEATAYFSGLVPLSGGNISVETVDHAHTLGQPRWSIPATDLPDLDAARFERSLDTTWRRSSFSSITFGTYVEHLWSEPATDAISDEQAPPDTPAPGSPTPPQRTAEPDGDNGRAGLDTTLPLTAMASGTEVGTVIHKVLEIVDFTALDLVPTLHEVLAAECAIRQAEIGDRDAVVEGIAAALDASLGPLALGARLRDIGRRDRVDEMSFELPLVGGDRVTGHLPLSALADLLRAHLPANDRLAPYVDRLDDKVLQRDLRGFLTGSLDLVLRIRPAGQLEEAEAKYFVADYKTNRLAPETTPLTPWHYRPDALQEEMLHAHYPLQGLLYVVALHRYLRWRIREYEPGRHLGGVLYLFLRGMSRLSPSFDGEPCGVWSWRPPAGLIEAVSDLFDRGIGIEVGDRGEA